ncbi:MAG: DNA polymerase III subunit [Clostridia bacterium]|nr:DNA polymerase III subunit [Clostridia bacterium]
MQFENFVGNAALKSALSGAFLRRRLPHAIILEGESGLGKRTLARIVARAAVCRAQNRDAAPCGVCPSCIRSAAGSHPDIRTVSGSGASGAVSAKSVEEVLSDAYRRPEEADVSVYLFFIDNGISDNAQNKLLKLIEEPPPGVIFIFTVPSADILLPTIRSRAQIFTVRAPEEAEAAVFVEQKTGMEYEAALALAALHRGNIGKMLSDGENGRAAKAAFAATEIALSAAERTEHELLAAAAPLLKDRGMFLETADRLQMLFRDACMLKSGVRTVPLGTLETAQRLSRRLSVKTLMTLCDLTARYAGYVQRNANMTLLVTAFCAELRKNAGR